MDHDHRIPAERLYPMQTSARQAAAHIEERIHTKSQNRQLRMLKLHYYRNELSSHLFFHTKKTILVSARPVWLVLPLWWDTVMFMSMMAKAFTQPDVKQRMFWIIIKPCSAAHKRFLKTTTQLRQKDFKKGNIQSLFV